MNTEVPACAARNRYSVGLPLAHSRCLARFVGVAFDKGDPIQSDPEKIVIEARFNPCFAHTLRVVELEETDMRPDQVRVRVAAGRVQTHGFGSLRRRTLELADPPKGYGSKVVGPSLPWIGFDSTAGGYRVRLKVTSHKLVVAGQDGESLPLADPVPQFEGSNCRFDRNLKLRDVRVGARQTRMRFGEVRIEFDGTSVEKDGIHLKPGRKA